MATVKESPIYVILDAARIFGELDTAQKLQTKFLSLYKGQSEELLSAVAPYLFHYQPNSEFANWLCDKGWGNAWGVFVQSSESLESLQTHFRRFLMVKTEDGRELYFRFYDPRVLRIFLPTCEPGQLQEFFGPVESYLLEDEDPNFAIRFTLKNNELYVEKITHDNFLKILEIPDTTVKPVTATVSMAIKNQKDTPDKPNRGWTFMVD